VPLLSTPIHKCRMKRPSNQTLITHSAQLAPGWSTDAEKFDYSRDRPGHFWRHQLDVSGGVSSSYESAVGDPAGAWILSNRFNSFHSDSKSIRLAVFNCDEFL